MAPTRFEFSGVSVWISRPHKMWIGNVISRISLCVCLSARVCECACVCRYVRLFVGLCVYLLRSLWSTDDAPSTQRRFFIKYIFQFQNIKTRLNFLFNLL